MAIISELDSKIGIKASYHRVLAVNINYKDKKVVICVASYIDKETRKNNYQPIEVIDIEIPKSDYHLFLGNDLQVFSYHWLKENVVGFEDALDDFDVLEPPLKEEIEEVKPIE